MIATAPILCACGHPARDHNCFWDDDNGLSGMGCDHDGCRCDNLDFPIGDPT